MKRHDVTFAEAAHMIVPDRTPVWFSAFLEWWSAGVQHDCMADDLRPTRNEAKEELAHLGAAATLIVRNLRSNLYRDYLEIQPLGPIRTTPTFETALQDLASRAEFASAAFSQAGGKAKSGRGRAMVPGHFCAKDLCAARIVELWLHFHGVEPGLRSIKAARAAEAYWRASGGESQPIGDPLNGWRHHFKTVNANENTPALCRLRLIWRHDIEQAARRGRPPWHLGTYFLSQSA